jgi:hypothetical protein
MHFRLLSQFQRQVANDNCGETAKKSTCGTPRGVSGMSRDEEAQLLHYIRVVSGNRITIPEDVRQALGIRVGDYVRAELKLRDKRLEIVAAE